MLDLEEARIERETSKMDFRRLCEQVHFFSRRSQKNPEDTMPSASLLRSSRTLPPVTFSPRRATTRFSRHPVRAFKEGARCFVLLRELAIRERAGGDDAATGQKRGFHVFFSPLGHVSLSLAPPQGTTSVHGTTFPLRFYACTLDVDRLFLRERKLETKRTLTIDLPSSLFFFDADEKPKKKKTRAQLLRQHSSRPNLLLLSPLPLPRAAATTSSRSRSPPRSATSTTAASSASGPTSPRTTR